MKLNVQLSKILLLIVIGVFPTLVFAATFEVTTFGDYVDSNPGDGICNRNPDGVTPSCSLRAAIQEANENDEDDTIILQSGETGGTILSIYRLTISNAGVPDNKSETGDLDVVKGVITIIGKGPEVTKVGDNARIFLDDGFSDRIFDVHQGATLVLQNLTVQAGNVDHFIADGGTRQETEGGGIRSIQSNLFLQNVHVTDNRAAGLGAGIYSLAGYLEVVDSQIYRNHEYVVGNISGLGTGIALNGGKALIRNTLIWDNPRQWGATAFANSDTPIGTMPPPLPYSADAIPGEEDFGAVRGPWAIMGGGIYSFGELTIENSAIIGNRAKVDGAGIYHGVGELIIKNTTISGNVADRSGGGLFVKRGYVGPPREQFGIEIPVNLLHVTMVDNHALGDDETEFGIFVDGFDPEFFGGYEGPSDVGILGGHDIAISGEEGQSFTQLLMANSIVGSCGFFEGSIVSLGNNLSPNADCALNHSGDIDSTNPLLEPINYNGSDNPSFRPAVGSPAISAANDWYCPQAVTDQRGMVRPLTDCYIGAYEEVPLTALNQPYVTEQNTPLTNLLRTNFSNPVDLEFEFVTLPSKGRVGLLDEESVGNSFVNGMFSYVPNLGESGTDTFTFKARDSNSGMESNIAEISIFINSPQAGPIQEEVTVELITVAPGASTSPAIVLSDDELSAEVADADYDLSLGVVFFNVTDIPQDSGLGYVDVEIQLPEILSPNLHNLTGPQLRKLDKFGRWHTLPGASTTQTSGFIQGLQTGFIPDVGFTYAWIITVRLYDNDIFDTDERVGFISDPIAVGFAKDPANFSGPPASFIPENNAWPQHQQNGSKATLSFPLVLLLSLFLPALRIKRSIKTYPVLDKATRSC